MRKIDVWGGTHGCEWESLALIYNFRNTSRRMTRSGAPKVPVHARIAHSRGHGHKREGVHNLAFAFPGVPRRPTFHSEAEYTQFRPTQIRRYSAGAYGVIDAHQIMNHGLRTGYIDKNRGVSPLMLGFLKGLGIDDLVVTEGWGMQGHMRNAMILESRYRPGAERDEVVAAIRRLSADPDHPTARAADFNWYAYAGGLTTEVLAPPLNNPESAYEPLEQLPDEFAAAVGLGGVALHVLNWRGTPMASGVWGEYAIRVPVPDDAKWPE